MLDSTAEGAGCVSGPLLVTCWRQATLPLAGVSHRPVGGNDLGMSFGFAFYFGLAAVMDGDGIASRVRPKTVLESLVEP